MAGLRAELEEVKQVGSAAEIELGLNGSVQVH